MAPGHGRAGVESRQPVGQRREQSLHGLTPTRGIQRLGKDGQGHRPEPVGKRLVGAGAEAAVRARNPPAIEGQEGRRLRPGSDEAFWSCVGVPVLQRFVFTEAAGQGLGQALLGGLEEQSWRVTAEVLAQAEPVELYDGDSLVALRLGDGPGP